MSSMENPCRVLSPEEGAGLGLEEAGLRVEVAAVAAAATANCAPAEVGIILIGLFFSSQY